MSREALPAQIEQALATLTGRLFDDARLPRAMAVACSGGLDSSVLLHAAHEHAVREGIRLHAFHIHHGLAAEADGWQAHVQAQAQRLGVPFEATRIAVDGRGNGIEEAARSGRYAALGALCRTQGVPLLLTAHHQDDQAETVLLQLLRGSGVAGLSGMDSCNTAPSLLGDPQLRMARPLLGLSRAELAQVARDAAISYIDDPSNADPRFARNALRHRVMPVLEEAFPGFAQRFARSARHAQAAQSLLITLAQEDFARCADGDDLLLDRLEAFDDARTDNLLRYWFGRNGMRMPSTAWLQQLRRQAFGARPDAQILIAHPDCAVHRHRNRLSMSPRGAQPDPSQAPQVFRWDGSATMGFAAFGGRLHFMKAEEGIDATWLRAQSLAVQWRTPGFRLKLAANRPSRSLKHHYQAADIPAWKRAGLPLVTIATRDDLPAWRQALPAAAPDEAIDEEIDEAMDAAGSEAAILALGNPDALTAAHLPPLLYAAGIGMDYRHVGSGGERIALRWQDDQDQAP